MSNYLRNRPFMIITYSRKPQTGQATQVAGWGAGDEDAWDVTENMIIADRISDKQMQFADVIIDLLNNSIVKNRLGSVADSTLVDGYVARYMVDVKKAMTRWVEEKTGDVEKIRQIAKDHGIELPEPKTDTSESSQ